jgi:hypothetical protein
LQRFNLKPLTKRILICVVIATVGVFALSEIAFYFQDDRVTRQPGVVEIVIPEGTAALVAQGLNPPDIPDEMNFVIGDELRVVNHDVVDHQLGPIWVPPGESASLKLQLVDHVAYACSFQPTQYLGIRVKEPTTIGTRLLALVIAVPPTAVMLLVYSLAAFPTQSLVGKKPSDADESDGPLSSEVSSDIPA